MSRKPWLLTAALLLMSAFAGAACNTITVADTLYDENGNLLNGTVTIVNSSTITGADGCVVPAFTSKKVTVTNGVLSVALVPNNGSTPSGTSYTVEYHVSSKYFTETWVVPASGPQTLSGVRALTPPVPTAMIAASQLNPPSPCTSSQVMTWNGTNWTCASAAGSVASVFGRTGTVTAQGGDYTAAQVTNAESTANKNAASGYAGLDSGSRIVKAQAPSATVYTDQANTYTAGMKQVFGASATTAGEGFSGVSGADPSGAVAGDRWYRTDLNCMRIFTSAAHCVMFADGAIAIGQTPLTTRGDLMTVNSGGALARLAIGGANTLLHGGTDPAYSAVAIGDVTGSSGTGNFLFATSPTATDATVNQAANGDNLLFGKRFTDTSPTGNLIYFQNAAANADLFKLDASGQVFLSNHLLFATDNSFDIGASAANRPRNIFAATQFGAPNGSCTTPSFGFTGSSTTGVAQSAGTLVLCGGAIQMGAGSLVSFNMSNGQATRFGGLTAVGQGLVSIRGAARSIAQTAAVASVAAYTPTADSSFEVSANVLVTTATSHAFTVTCAYTDEGNTARTITLPFTLVAGSAIVNSIANANGAVPYLGIPVHIRAKASTAITIATTGTFTTVTYNVEGLIRQVN